MAKISLAHPDFRDELFHKAQEAGWIDRNRTLNESLFGIYPVRMEETRIYDGQRVIFRPAKPGDDRLIQEHFYSMDEAEAALQQPVVKRLLWLMEFRSNYPAFSGRFELNYSNDSSVDMGWRHGEYYCRLFVDLNFNTATIDYVDEASMETVTVRC